ncbi:LPXTG cell wall anchor domain-containing protein [Actinomyces vulturis]|uniref:LPXTG cell wall anchor domain-containing protein n=1 Tax=Actinomyces vulturis TaxID=1857645 RepID=UPI0008340B67|nr:LPXTG cell wall anchor domain-containing protein [Actinomyces vulturis]
MARSPHVLTTGKRLAAIAATAFLTLSPVAAHAVNVGPNDDGAGTRIISNDDRWTANMHLGGAPEYAATGSDFTIAAEIYENHDVDLDNPDAVHESEQKEYLASGMVVFGVTPGITIDSITWQCNDRLGLGEGKACSNHPTETLKNGEGFEIAGTTYQQIMISPYTLREYAGWDLEIHGTFTQPGKQSFFLSGVDASYLEADPQLAAQQLDPNGMVLNTTVNGTGAPDPSEVKPTQIAELATAVTQDVKDIHSGDKRTYTVTYANKSDKDIHDAHVSGVYLVLPEVDGSTRYSVRCADSSTAQCPAWVDGRDEEIPVSDHDHDHEHGHGHDHDGDHHDHDGATHDDHDEAEDAPSTGLNFGIARFGNAYDGLIDLNAGEELVLTIEVTTTLQPHHGDFRPRVASFDAFIRETPGITPSDNSVLAEGTKGMIYIVDADNHGDEGDNDHHGDEDEGTNISPSPTPEPAPAPVAPEQPGDESTTSPSAPSTPTTEATSKTSTTSAGTPSEKDDTQSVSQPKSSSQQRGALAQTGADGALALIAGAAIVGGTALMVSRRKAQN